MAITICKKDFPYTHWEIIQVDTGDRLRIVPERGGLITEWCCNGREILYFDHQRFLEKGKSVRGGIPILFPICGKLPGNCLPLEQGNFFIDQHGFARNSIWKIRPRHDYRCISLSFSDNEITRLSYPFCFFLEMEIRFIRNGINFRILIHNRSQFQMPFSFGLHPYFNIKDLNKTQIDGLMPNCFDQCNMLETQTEQQLKYLPEGVDFISGPSKSVFLIDQLAGKSIEIQHQEPMDLSVVWTDPPRSMVCLEPWTSPRESLISGERRLSLDPGAIQKLSCSFLVD